MFIREVRLFACVSPVSCTNKTDGAQEILLKLALIRHNLIICFTNDFKCTYKFMSISTKH